MNRQKKKIGDLEEKIYQIEKELCPECKKKFNARAFHYDETMFLYKNEPNY